MSRDQEDFWLELLIVLALCWLLIGSSGCAGAEAMRWKPPPQKKCGVMVCESRSGKINPSTDCHCSGRTGAEVLQDIGR